MSNEKLFEFLAKRKYYHPPRFPSWKPLEKLEYSRKTRTLSPLERKNFSVEKPRFSSFSLTMSKRDKQIDKRHRNCERNRHKSTARCEKTYPEKKVDLRTRKKSEADVRDNRHHGRKNEFCDICRKLKVRNSSRRVTFERVQDKL